MPKQSRTSKSTKNSTSHREWHSSGSSLGMGDFYGTGIRNPQGKMRDGYGERYTTPEKLKVPPKKLA